MKKSNYEQLRDLILRGQIYTSMHSDIVMFLKERSPKSVKDIRSLADKYRTAPPSKPLAKEHSILANVGFNKIQEEANKMNILDKIEDIVGETYSFIKTAPALNHVDHLES